ncbi:coiled-coil domain-containing protein 186-like [Polistes fuscatus]|uniref:coiled-coil domain-containing protein 186-like n=1 Tax=Polistes fuscatus TaxID=30207 RepID=UPI001CAA3329|nr:coiled-coil domain-containing protein 186-like [Polistes fuscatus]
MNIVEEPAPQWLIEEALNRGDEVRKEKEWQKSVEPINKEIEYENIITELENKLSETKVELEEAIRKKSFIKEKYKRIVENVQVEASKENEALQQKIVQICTSVLDKFGSYALSNNKTNVSRRNNNYKSSRYFGKLSKRLYKKLRDAITKSKKLKNELAKTRKELKDKSNEYESVNNCFTRLKQEMETTETNLNDLIAENTSLRKKFEDMKEWMEMKIGKEQNERISATQIRELPKYRELAKLKKKSEEDCATIKQLHNKLLRSESANANKGFLLNSYKGQLSDLTKEKDLFTLKIKELENELTALRTTNAQLKAKISLINEEKENLTCKVEKSQTDLKQQIESEINRKYEESMQNEINSVKIKCEDAIKVLKDKLITFESKNYEYSKAIKEFLQKIHDHWDEQEGEKINLYGSEACEREACETACNILNMTPEELAKFMNGKSNTINTWLTDLNKITSKNSFSDGLAKFLFKTTLDKIHTSA